MDKYQNRQLALALAGVLMMGTPVAYAQSPSVQSLSEEDLLLLLEAKRQQAQQLQAKSQPNSQPQPQKSSSGQATLTALPIQVPNEIDLPPMQLVNAAAQNAQPKGALATSSPIKANTPTATNTKSQTSPKQLTLTEPVIDEAKILTAEEIAILGNQLRNIYGDQLAQGAIVIVPSTNGVPIFDYALQVAERWGLGDETIDNGLLILVAINDRELFILTGRGLEGVLPDARLKQIIRDIITPHFKEEQYANGLSAGVNEIEKRLRADPQTLAAADKASTNANDQSPIPFFVIAWLIGSFLIQMFGRVLGATVASGGFLLLSLIAGFGWVVAILGAILLFLVIVLLTGQNRGFRHSGHSHRIGRGGSFGGGFGGSSYRGGGGSFGGGGAGGSW